MKLLMSVCGVVAALTIVGMAAEPKKVLDLNQARPSGVVEG